MRSFLHVIRNFFGVFLDALVFIRLCLRPTVGVAAENLFLRKQLGLYMEREVKPRRATDSIRFTLARLSPWFDWRQALIVVWPCDGELARRAMLAQPRGPDPGWDTTCRRLLATYLAGLGTLTPR